MATLSTVDLAKLMQEIDNVHPMDLEDSAEEIDYTIDDIVDLNYLDPLYGDRSRLTYEEWIERSIAAKRVSEVFYRPQNMRMLVLTRADIKAAPADADDFTKVCEEHKVNLSQERVE